MFFISLGFFCILVISKCIIAEEEETSLFPTTEFGDDAPFFSDYSSFTDPGDLEGSLGSDLIDPTFGTLNDEDDGAPVPIFADSNEICSFDTSQLIGSLSRRGVANNCDNSEGSNVLKAPTISPKVAPFIDLKTMELKKICPGRLRWPYTVAVCSSGSRGDIIMYPQDATFDLFWAQQITVGVLLACVNPRHVFCCKEFREGVYVTSLGATIQFRGQGISCQLLDPFDFFDVLGQVVTE